MKGEEPIKDKYEISNNETFILSMKFLLSKLNNVFNNKEGTKKRKLKSFLNRTVKFAILSQNL